MAKAKRFTAPGDRFGFLVVEGAIFREGRVRKVQCRCDCGAAKVVYVDHLFRGATTNCGCQKVLRAIAMGRKNATHGSSRKGNRSPTYLSWASMHLRCRNPNATGYSNYGGRGIQVCERWCGPDGFSNFLLDMGERPDGMTLDRVDADGGYTPSNCQWAGIVQQKRNRRNAVLLTYKGETKSAAEWAREVGTHRNNILRRLKRGLPMNEVIR